MTVGGFAVTEIPRRSWCPSALNCTSVFSPIPAAHPRPLLMISARGGMDIEELAAAAPDSLYRLHADPAYGLHPYQARDLARRSGLSVEGQGALTKIIGATYRAYWESDAELVEINPLVLTTAGDLVAVDAKVTIDNAARGRHPDIKGAEIDSVETRAAAMGLSYVELEGDIGLISNGAGLTMATMDHLALLGGRPANFLDTGSASCGWHRRRHGPPAVESTRQRGAHQCVRWWGPLRCDRPEDRGGGGCSACRALAGGGHAPRSQRGSRARHPV